MVFGQEESYMKMGITVILSLDKAVFKWWTRRKCLLWLHRNPLRKVLNSCAFNGA